MPLDWSPPQEFHEYSIIRRLGSGGMGQVYLARDGLLDRLVAIKFMVGYHDPAARARFLREARAAARLQHHRVVAVYRIGELGECPYIVSEFIRGTPLSRVRKPVPWQRALEIGRGLAGGLAAAHRSGVLHRDIKPANAILGHDDQIKLLDFGLAKLEQLTETSSPPAPSAEDDEHGDGAHVSSPSEDGQDSTETLPPDSQPDSLPDTGFLVPPAVPGRRRMISEAELLDPLDAPSADEDTFLLAPAASAKAVPVDDPTPEAPSGLHSVRAPMGGLDASDAALTIQGAIMGTPYYMAPEVWQGQEATRRSDVYSLGVVLFELVTGAPPHSSVAIADLARVANQEDAPSLDERDDLPPEYVAIVDRCLHRDPAERFASAIELWDALEELAVGEQDHAVVEGNPYRGLLPFSSEHRAMFFGRGAEIRTILDRLRSQQLLLVAGASGVGKSSVCRAGVWPGIEDGALGGERTWKVASMVPSHRPLRALAAVLGPHLQLDLDAVVELAQTNVGDIRRLLVQAQGQDRGLVLFIDQFEELVTVSDPEEAALVSAILADFSDYAPGLRVLATAREDYLTRLAALSRLGSELARAFHWLQPLDAEQIRATIVGPARATGVAFESEELIESLVHSATRTRGGLPLLQFALARLWDARDPECGITQAALDELGGLEGALAGHADGVLQGLLSPQRQAMRRILMRLVNLEGTRIRRTEDELGAEDTDGRQALEAMVRGRLLVAREDEGETVYEIAHEALLSGWPTLQQWLDSEVDIRAERARIVAAAAEWHGLERSRHLLWRRGQLSRLRGRELGDLPSSAAEFLAASRRAQRRRDWLAAALVISVLLVVGGVYAATRIANQRALDRKVDGYVSSARALMEHARANNARVETLRAQAFGLFDDRKREQAEEVWQDVRAQAAEVDREYAEASQGVESALKLAADRPHLRSLMAEILYQRALLAERDSELERMHELLQRLAVYDDGIWLDKWHAPATLHLRTEPAGARVSLEEHVRQRDGTIEVRERGALGQSPLTDLSLAPGSYVLRIEQDGRFPVRYPVLLARTEQLTVEVPLLLESRVPEGFVYVPAGRFLFGSNNEDMRGFWETTPLRQRETDGYFIARHETTYAQWIEFLLSLPAEKRADNMIKSAGIGGRGNLELTQQEDGRWQLMMAPYRALEGELLEYRERDSRTAQDWRKFPVTGISSHEAIEYAAWLAANGGIPNARLCREDEWERAARGADRRKFVHGDTLRAQEANIDRTYKRRELAFGPDVVGTYSRVQSPFGLYDMNGNVYEFVISVLDQADTLVRGGSFFYASSAAANANRAAWGASWREASVGFRLCADVP